MHACFFIAPLLIIVYVTILFLIAQLKKDNSIADMGWAGGIILVSLSSFLLYSSWNRRALILNSLIVIWGMRLTYYIVSRHKGEDIRYKEWRASWGKSAFVKAFVYVFILQGFLMLVVASPAMIVNTAYSVPALHWLGFVAIVVWIFGFLLETIADYQLQQFLVNPNNKGQICAVGLWGYSRHPNYFGESCMWWAIFLLALPVPYGWITVISPLIITGLFLFISIPITEQQFADNVAYQEYKKKTSSFLLFYINIR